jgi:formamidopyrimidine-DNA glycosylase
VVLIESDQSPQQLDPASFAWSTPAITVSTMPELPEVERAAHLLRRAIAGKTIRDLALKHPSLKRRVSPARVRTLRGATVRAVERRGKHQLILLADGRIIHIHFRMTGDWHIDHIDGELPRFARAVITFDDGTRVVLDDPRALSTLDVHAAGNGPDLRLGPEPSESSLTPGLLAAAFTRRRGPIKTVLLDQGVIAGLGNIYAAEALWRARIDPRVSASQLSDPRVALLLKAVRRVIGAASGARYRDASGSRFDVYDREGKPCRRCRTPIARIVQAGRSTYFCPGCQTP